MPDELIRVIDVYGEIQYQRLFITRIICILEDGRTFFLERVPFDIVLALKRIHGEEIPDDRERLVDILLSMPHVLNEIGKNLKRIIINELDEKTGVYSALAEFSDGEVTIRRKMVPSHAIFLAVLTNKPIYVRKKLVDEQEELIHSIDFSDLDEETGPEESSESSDIESLGELEEEIDKLSEELDNLYKEESGTHDAERK